MSKFLSMKHSWMSVENEKCVALDEFMVGVDSLHLFVSGGRETPFGIHSY